MFCGVDGAGFAGAGLAGLVPVMWSYQYWARAIYAACWEPASDAGHSVEEKFLWPNTFLPQAGRPSL